MNLEHQTAQLSIRNSPARMQISWRPEQITIQNEKPQLQIETQMPTFRVPSQRIRSESGLAGPVSFAKQFAGKGRQAAMRAAATFAAEGDYIANTGIPGDKSIPMMVSNKMRNYFRKPETNIGLMPSSPPSLDWTRGYINVNATRHNISVNWSGSNTAQVSVDINFPVEVSLSGRPSVRVSSIEPAVENRTMGRYIDRTV
jgi:hypothetical protein